MTQQILIKTKLTEIEYITFFFSYSEPFGLKESPMMFIKLEIIKAK